MRARRERSGSDISGREVHGHLTPAQQFQVEFIDLRLDKPLAVAPFGLVYRQEHITRRIGSLLGQLDTQVAPGDFFQESMGNTHQDSGAVSGVDLTATPATVLHLLKGIQRVGNNLVAGHTFYMRDKANPAAVLFKLGSVESLAFG